MGFDVFISHSSKDKLTADAVCALLEERKIRCWIAPRDIQGGADWGEAIMQAIQECRIMVLVFSQNANESKQIKREVNRALHYERPVLPLRIERIDPTGMLEYSLSTTHWLDAFTPPMEQHLTHLADTVEAILSGRMKAPPPPLPPKKPWWQSTPVLAVAAVVVLALLFFAFHGKSSSGQGSSTSGSSQEASLKGTWEMHQPILAPLQSAFTDLISAALKGPTTKATMEVKSLNEYTLSVTSSDSGTVAPAPDRDGVKALAFVSNTTHATMPISCYPTDNSNSAYGAFGVGAGEKVLMFGMNMGAGTVVVHGSPDGSDSSGAIDPAFVGKWIGSPFNVNPPNGLWGGTLTIHANGTYDLSVTHQESGILTASNGSWTAKPSATGVWVQGAPSLFNDPGASVTYELTDSNTLEIGTTYGALTFKRE